MIMIGEGCGSFQLNSDSLARLDRFQHRTASTFATARVRELYQNDVIKIALAVFRPFQQYNGVSKLN